MSRLMPVPAEQLFAGPGRAAGEPSGAGRAEHLQRDMRGVPVGQQRVADAAPPRQLWRQAVAGRGLDHSPAMPCHWPRAAPRSRSRPWRTRRQRRHRRWIRRRGPCAAQPMRSVASSVRSRDRPHAKYPARLQDGGAQLRLVAIALRLRGQPAGSDVGSLRGQLPGAMHAPSRPVTLSADGRWPMAGNAALRGRQGATGGSGHRRPLISRPACVRPA